MERAGRMKRKIIASLLLTTGMALYPSLASASGTMTPVDGLSVGTLCQIAADPVVVQAVDDSTYPPGQGSVTCGNFKAFAPAKDSVYVTFGSVSIGIINLRANGTSTSKMVAFARRPGYGFSSEPSLDGYSVFFYSHDGALYVLPPGWEVTASSTQIPANGLSEGNVSAELRWYPVLARAVIQAAFKQTKPVISVPGSHHRGGRHVRRPHRGR
jgi:hypothetical protein